ncbi:MAG: hypothetical protein IT384_29630 [Deltaproteobacteria bacterium]|nr:hypothetical protein [Deltaproteobacteria bacterium]
MGMTIFVRTADGKVAALDAPELERRASLLFRYTNREDWTHVLVFAVDEHLRYYWLFPEVTAEEPSPKAVPIQRGEGDFDLPRRVVPDIEGSWIQLKVIFTRQALSTGDVEALARAERPPGAPIVAGGHEVELLLRIVSPPPPN